MMLRKNLDLIIEKFEQKINKITPECSANLLKGDLAKVEKDLEKCYRNLHGELVQAFIVDAMETKELEATAQVMAQKQGLTEIRKTEVKLQLKTGQKIRVPSFYALRSPSKRKKKKRGPNGSGTHLILDYWGCLEKATPGYYSLVGMLTVLCPSFDVAMKVLEHQKIRAEYKRIRQISYNLGEKCFADRVKIGLKSQENLSGKRVIISIDGGRTRTRVENEEKKPSEGSKGKGKKFDTPWREPKLFVIQVLKKNGKTSKTELPIYDCTLGGADASFELLEKYLKELKIQDASEILFIADGSLWIWERVEKMMSSLGVKKEKLVEAVDYYHTAQHLNDLVLSFSDQQLSEEKRKSYLKKLKDHLYHGRITRLVRKIKALAKKYKIVLSGIQYFQKNKHRMQYDALRKQKLPLGSGIVESAIRRIINLRFKSPSSFWLDSNVEKLIFLRCIFLAGRWNIMIKNLILKSNSLSFFSNKKHAI